MFPNSSDKMKLPWNKISAIQLAREYYEHHYEKEIRYQKVKVLGLSDGAKETFYLVYFNLKKEPECDFWIKVNYDLDTDKIYVSTDRYLVSAMDGRMTKEVKDDIDDIYGKGYEIIFDYDPSVVSDESVSLDEVKSAAYCNITLMLNNHELTANNQYKEAEKLLQLYNRIHEKGYQMKKIYYSGKKYGKKLYISFDVPKLKDIEDARKVIEKALENEIK